MTETSNIHIVAHPSALIVKLSLLNSVILTLCRGQHTITPVQHYHHTEERTILEGKVSNPKTNHTHASKLNIKMEPVIEKSFLMRYKRNYVYFWDKKWFCRKRKQKLVQKLEEQRLEVMSCGK